MAQMAEAHAIPPEWAPARDLIAEVRALGRSTLGVEIESRFRESIANDESLEAMAESGLLGLTLPVEWGGRGRDYTALAAVCEELGAIDVAHQISLTVHLALVAMTILQWGTDEQKRRWLPALASGREIGTFGLTEPGAGSDVAALRMRANPVEGGYLLNGEKTWISAANQATVFLLFATVDPARRHHGITCFIVPRKTDGLSTTELRGKLGARAGDTGSVHCDDVFVADDQVLGHVGEGFVVALAALGLGLFTVGCGALGIARACREITADLLRERRADIGSIEASELAKMVRREEQARLLLARAASLKNAGAMNARETGMAKWKAAEAAYANGEAALWIQQVLAGPHEESILRHLANAKGAVVYGGTAEIHQTMQGSYALGRRAERPFRMPPLTFLPTEGEHDV